MPNLKKISGTKKITPHTHRHKDGSIWAKGSLKNGNMEGYWQWFRKDGSVMRTGHLKASKQVGEWATYDKNGRIVKITNFDKKKGKK